MSTEVCRSRPLTAVSEMFSALFLNVYWYKECAVCCPATELESAVVDDNERQRNQTRGQSQICFLRAEHALLVGSRANSTLPEVFPGRLNKLRVLFHSAERECREDYYCILLPLGFSKDKIRRN
jgi:hypothetical protein